MQERFLEAPQPKHSAVVFHVDILRPGLTSCPQSRDFDTVTASMHGEREKERAFLSPVRRWKNRNYLPILDPTILRRLCEEY
jgi:hypothetical protein